MGSSQPHTGHDMLIRRRYVLPKAALHNAYKGVVSEAARMHRWMRHLQLEIQYSQQTEDEQTCNLDSRLFAPTVNPKPKTGKTLKFTRGS
jgi:hypothetical protein